MTVPRSIRPLPLSHLRDAKRYWAEPREAEVFEPLVPRSPSTKFFAIHRQFP